MAIQNSNSEPEQTKLTLADTGVPSVSIQPIQTPIGKCQRFRDLKKLETAFLFLMLCYILAATGFTVYRITTLETTAPDFTFCVFLLVNAVFCTVFTIDAIFRERPSEIIVLILTTLLILIYLSINYAVGSQNEIKLARLILASIAFPFLAIMGIFIAKDYIESKHLIIRTVGAFAQNQKLYRNLLYFQDMLKFDLQLWISIVIFALNGESSIEIHEIAIIVVCTCLQIAYFFFGWLTFGREKKKLAVVFWVIGLLEFAYIFWKMYDVSTYITHFTGLAGATITCILVALLTRSTLLIGSICVYKGFNQGLKALLFPNSNAEFARTGDL